MTRRTNRNSKKQPKAKSPLPPPRVSTMPTWVATLFFSLFVILVIGGVTCFFLYQFKLLPSWIGTIGAAIAAIASVFVGVVSLFGKMVSEQLTQSFTSSVTYFIDDIWHNAKKKTSTAVGIGITIIICVTLVFFQPKDVTQATNVLTNAPHTSLSTMTAQAWHPLLKETAPHCNDPRETNWYVHKDGTFYKCTQSYLLMQRISPSHYADMELVDAHCFTRDLTHG